jgi:hypothetical protein
MLSNVGVYASAGQTYESGSTSATISVAPVDDVEMEGSEGFTLNLSASGYLLGASSSASVTIEDNDASSSPTVHVTASPTTINEGSSSSPAVFTFTREGSSASSLTLYYFLTGDATNYTDYRDQATGNSVSGSVTIPAGSSSATISVVPVDNSDDAPNKSLTLNLYESGCTLGSSSTATVTIEDDDLPTVNVWASPTTIYEQSASSPSVLTFQRLGDLTNSLTVYFSLGGSATNGDDYRDQSTSTSVASSIVIPAGSSSASISVVPVDDTDDDDDDIFEPFAVIWLLCGWEQQ